MKFLITFSIFITSIFSDSRLSTTYENMHVSDVLFYSFKGSSAEGKKFKHQIMSFKEASDEELSMLSIKAYKPLFNLGWRSFFITNIGNAANNTLSIKAPKIFHIDSINVDKMQDLKLILKQVKAISPATKVSFFLSDINVNSENRLLILNFLKEHVDLLFCDSHISRKLTGLSSKLSSQYFFNVLSIKSIIFEKNGSWIIDKKTSLFHPFPQKDMSPNSLFVCGFLHGMLKDLSLIKCLNLGFFFLSNNFDSSDISKELQLVEIN